MITIKGFARLCACSTQTLRYYDRIGLLVPAKVDAWTGYRYYEEKQALRFVKIKNLQQADFSIEEIRPLLEADDAQLMEAFERKIREQRQKLEKIQEIQQSYLTETMEIQKMVLMIADFMEGRIDNPRLWEEFGIDDAGQAEVKAHVREMMADWMSQIRGASEEIARNEGLDLEAMEAFMKLLSGDDYGSLQNSSLSVPGGEGDSRESIPADAEKVFERSGWAHVSDWIDEIPDLEDGKHSYFDFRVWDNSPGNPVTDPVFPLLMLAVMASRYHAMQGGMHCHIGKSEDGLNHFTLFCK